MESAMFYCPAAWRRLLPGGVWGAEEPQALQKTRWTLLALTPEGRSALKTPLRCHTLLTPGDRLPAGEAETVITYGLSPRDSLTLSSLREPVLCVQRALPRPDGAMVEPQELPLPPLPGAPEALLPLLGLRLLLMPLSAPPFLW